MGETAGRTIRHLRDMATLQRCQNGAHEGLRWHATAAGRIDCDWTQALWDEADRWHALSDVKQWSERAERQARADEARLQRAADAAAATHVQIVQTDPEEVKVVRNANRQMLGAAGQSPQTLGLLMTTDMYHLNQLLRRGSRLDVAPGAMFDWYGYDSYGRFFDVLQRLLARMGEELVLDEPLRVWRGIGLYAPDEPDPLGIYDREIPDVLRLRELIAGTLSAPYEADDPGLGFSAASPELARHFDGPHATRRDDPTWRVLLEIDARHALCIPSPEHRSPDVVARLHTDSLARGAVGQVVLPPSSRFRVADYAGIDEAGWHHVRVEQLAPDRAAGAD